MKTVMNLAMHTGRVVLLVGLMGAASICAAQEPDSPRDLDRRVEAFLDSRRNTWRDMNVPASDGRVLYDLIVQNGYTRALEVGTSTGHSAIWMAWALSKTGGRLITIEIDEGRYREAVAHFEEAGLSAFIDARLADAHTLVPALDGPFDFIFVDADKDWYTRYFQALLPKLEVGGCYTAHNVSGRAMRGIGDFLDVLYQTPHLETEIVRASRSGLSVSYKKAPE